MTIEKFEGHLFDNYDNGICCVVNSHRYSAEHETTREIRTKFNRNTDNSKEFGKK